MTTATVDAVTFPSVGSAPVQLCPAGSGQINVYNGDLSTVLLVSASQNPSPTNSVPVQPLTNATIDGTRQQWAVAESGNCLNVTVGNALQMSPSPAQIAAQIAGAGLATAANQNTQIGQLTSTPLNTIAEEVASLIATGSVVPLSPGGTPLLHGADALFDNQNFALAASATVFTAQTSVSKPGYVIAINPFYTTANGANGFVQVDVRWLNLAGTKQLAFERWMVPVNAIGSGANTIFGKGPTKGPKVQLRLTNLDTVQPVTFNVDLWETTQHIPRDDWRSGDVFPTWVAPPGFTTAPNSDPSSNAILQFATPPNLAVGTVSWLLPLYAGQANLSWSFLSSGGAGTVSVLIQALSITGTSGQGLIYSSGTLNLSATVPTILNNQILTLPRRPCLMQVSVGAFPLAGSIGIQPLEYTS